MTTKPEILEAYNKVYTVIQSGNLWINLRNEAEKAATLLRDNALKAIPEASALTATQLDDRGRQAEIIAHGDNLEVFAAIMPYLLRRREGARMYMDRPSDGALEYLTAINKKISELLNLF
jgi:hypothetical protein